jgi:hypothetical protein
MKKLNRLAVILGLTIFLTACAIRSDTPAELTLRDGTVLKCPKGLRVDSPVDQIVCNQESSTIIVDWRNIFIIKK